MDKNRRGFMAWVAGFFGLGVVTEVASAIPVVPTVEPIVERPKGKAKGFIALTINVGQFPPFKAEAFCERMKEKFINSDARRALDEWEVIVLPVRNQETKIEIFATNGNPNFDGYMTVEKLNAQKLMRDDTPFEFPNKKQVVDYTLMMLGAPICKVELEDCQLDAAYDATRQLFERVAKSKGIGAVNRDGMGQEVFKNIMIARATIMLGHARSKYQDLQHLRLQVQNPGVSKFDIPGAKVGYTLDGEELVEEGNENLIYWTQYLDAI
jgi:hypothetical protein